MTIHARWNVDIPECSLQKWLFGGSTGPLSDKPIFIDPERPDTHHLSLQGYRQWAKRLALGLQKAGLKPGDRVLLFSGNNLFFPVVFMGILMAGGVFTGANPSFVARELAYQLKDSGASFLIAADASIPIALEAAQEAGLPKSRCFSFDDTALDASPGKTQQGARHWTELLASQADAEKFDWVEPADPKNTTCCLNYSSGTTGVPKGVEITHRSYIANGVGVIYMSKLQDNFEENVKKWRSLCFLPMYHAYGQTYFAVNYPKLGVPAYMMPKFDFVKVLENVQKYRITSLTCVPPIVVALAKHPLVRKYDLSSLESIGSGAAPLSGEIAEEVSKLWPAGAMEVRQGWGMTEITCTALSWDPRITHPSLAVGELLPNCSARLVKLDGSGEITKAGETGELWVTGPTLLKSYWNKPEATADTLHVDADGTRWLKTGDIAYVEKYEPGGLWHVVDRLKELIKVKGNQVAPAELEGVLLESKAVSDAAVVGVTIDGEEVPRAYIVPNPEIKATEQEIAQWMEGRVVRYKRLAGGVVFVDEVPKNPSGKILRKLLRDRAKAEVGDKQAKL
ncbi:AMP-binding enzyme [Apiospora arundinis]|uniref:Acetyl-CoA synthetase-like protein n=1 Tax=Apiospora arundinis TaxID=335852 RepID=A0ABR2JBQ4_9PEZI